MDVESESITGVESESDSLQSESVMGVVSRFGSVSQGGIIHLG